MRPIGTCSTIGVFTDIQSNRRNAVNKIFLSLGTATLLAISIANAVAKDKQS